MSRSRFPRRSALPATRPVRFLCLALAAAFTAAAGVRASDITFKLADAQGLPVADAVLTLTPLDGAKTPPLPADARAEITQRDKQFSPRVIVLPVGGTVAFSNREPKLMHQIYSVSDTKSFEIPLHKPGNSASITFDHPGLVVIGCSIHDGMSAFIVVTDTPWFAKSAPSGQAVIASAPAGRYRLSLWHPRLEKAETRELDLPASQPIALTLGLKPEPRAHRILEPGGGGYR